MAEETKIKSVNDVVTNEMIERAMARGVKGAQEDVREFLAHVHTLFDRISDLYDEYVIALIYFGLKVNLTITDKDGNVVVESSLGTSKGETE